MTNELRQFGNIPVTAATFFLRQNNATDNQTLARIFR